jgi:hypothetical protein
MILLSFGRAGGSKREPESRKYQAIWIPALQPRSGHALAGMTTMASEFLKNF